MKRRRLLEDKRSLPCNLEPRRTRQFCPDNDVTREEMAAFIVRAVTGTPSPMIYNPTPYFTDVDSSNPFFPHIQKLKELGITSGCSQNMFCPTATIPRWEVGMLMMRARLSLVATLNR